LWLSIELFEEKPLEIWKLKKMSEKFEEIKKGKGVSEK